MAALLVSYVDDMRAAKGDEQLCWRLMHHVSSQLTYLGNQIATHKMRPASQNPGPWAGSVVSTDENLGIGVRATQEKWDNVKCLLEGLRAQLEKQTHLHLKELEGFGEC